MNELLAIAPAPLGLSIAGGIESNYLEQKKQSGRVWLVVREWEEREEWSEIVFGDAACLVLSTVRSGGSGGGATAVVGRDGRGWARVWRRLGERGGGGAQGGGAVAKARRARWLAAARWRSARVTCSGRVRRESCGQVGDLGF